MASPGPRRSLVVVSPYRAGYGPQQVLAHVCRAAEAAGFDPVCVVPSRHAGNGGLDGAARVYEVPELATVPRTLSPARLATFLRAHGTAAREIERIAAEVDAVAIHTVSEAVFAGSLAGRRLGLPSLVHVIGMSIGSPAWAAQVYIRFLDRLSDEFIACSSAVAELLARNGVADGAIAVVHNAIDVSEVDAAAPVELAEPGPRVGMVAAFDPRKGHELFVDATADVHARFPDARFFVIGGVLDEQPESRRFAREIERRIAQLGLADCFRLVGHVPRPDVFRWLKAMDVIVVPSRTEAFAHALIEGMAAGKPVVATAVGGNLDAFVQRHSGIYVAPEPAELAAAVCGLLADEELATRIGSAARERVRLLFSLEAIGPALAEALRGLVARHSRVDPG